MTQTVSILGSTGSIGRQTLDVIDSMGSVRVAALTAGSNAALLEDQCRKYRPDLAVLQSEEAAADLRVRLADTGIRVASGMEGLIEAASLPQADTVVTSVMGMVGLRPTLAAIHEKKRIALANKETLVCAGELVMSEAARCGAEIVPVDSEHSAIFQCISGLKSRSEIRKLILTASGGPFFGMSGEELCHVTKAQALKHPNWSMGQKITIDSATMMNKGLEFIEAMRLYSLPAEQVQIVVHRKSIVHSLAEFCDGTVMAQLGVPDMRIPIQLALTWPERRPSPAAFLDLLACGELSFLPPDTEHFPCLPIAIGAAKTGGTACAVLNGANEAAVDLFLRDQIGFYDIPRLVQAALDEVPPLQEPTLGQILDADAAGRESVLRHI